MGGQGAAGTVYGQIGITKNSGASCVLYGYALVTYQDGYGTVLPIHISHSPVDHLAFFADPSANKLPTMVRMSIGSVAKIDYSYSDVSNRWRFHKRKLLSYQLRDLRTCSRQTRMETF